MNTQPTDPLQDAAGQSAKPAPVPGREDADDSRCSECKCIPCDCGEPNELKWNPPEGWDDAQPAPSPAADSRKRFEEWAKSVSMNIKRGGEMHGCPEHEKDEYFFPHAVISWRAWQAAERQAWEAHGAEIAALHKDLTEWTSEDDEPLPEDAEIMGCHPVNLPESERHDLYVEAMRLVGARRSKYGLINLLHWQLRKSADLTARIAQLESCEYGATCNYCMSGAPHPTGQELHDEIANQGKEIHAQRGRIAQLETALRVEIEDLVKRTEHRTHWDGCEESHPMCAAIVRIKQALAVQAEAKEGGV
jgi:hypothetical protein